MPEGLVRTDLNKGGQSFRDGQPVTPPIDFGTPITEPHEFGTMIPVSDPTLNSNPVDWATPDPAHFGNVLSPMPQQDTPTFNPPAGEYVGAIFVEIVSAGNDAIYYTTDGSTPTTSSSLYNPIDEVLVSTSETLKAIAVRAGYTQSQVGSAAYTIDVIPTPSIVQSKYSDINTLTPSVAFDAPSVSGNNILLFFVVQSPAAPTLVTDDQGNTYTLVVNSTTGTGFGNAKSYCYMTTSATPVTTVSWSQGSNAGAAIIVEVTPASVDTSVQASPLATSSSPMDGGPITPSTDADLILAWFAAANSALSSTFGVGAGYTLVASHESASGPSIGTQSGLEYQVSGAAGDYAVTMTSSGNVGNANSVTVALKYRVV